MSDAMDNHCSTADPLISVIIASVNGLPAIAECLDALVHQQGDVSHEILVLDCCEERTRSVIRERFCQPQVQLIPVQGRESIPKLRAMGMTRARGRIIAILEDHCNVVPEWFQVMARAHAAGYQAIGGAVENGSVKRIIDWAVFFCEYARFMLPVRRGVVPEITGNNSAYDRQLLERLGPQLHEEVWESFLHERIRELDVPFYCEPQMIVYHKKEFGYGYFMAQRYYYSRSFAGMRVNGAPTWRRLAYACATPLLPPLLLSRMLKTVSQKRRHRKEFILALPIIGTFLLSWAWGEAMGALFGPGESLTQVE